MGINVSFPVAAEPISYEKNDRFSSTGKRVPQNVLDDLIARNGFEMITEEFFHDLLAERQEIMKAKMKFQDINVSSICAKYPQWKEDNINDFKVQFQNFDLNKDGLIDFEELKILMDELGDKSDEMTRRNYFDEIDIDNSEGIDFEEFLQLIETVYSTSEEDQDQLGEICRQGTEKAKKVRRLSVVQQMQAGLF